MKMYVVSFLAVNEQGRVVHTPGHVIASSQSDAEVRAYAACLEHLPARDGWHDHSVSVMEFKEVVVDQS